MAEKKGLLELQRIFGKGIVCEGHKGRYLFKMPEEVAGQADLEWVQEEHERLFLDLAEFLSPDDTTLLGKDRRNGIGNYYFPYYFNIRDIEKPEIIVRLKEVETGAYDHLVGYPLFKQREAEENADRERYFILSRLNDLHPTNKWESVEINGKRYFQTVEPVLNPMAFTYFLSDFLGNPIPLQTKEADHVRILEDSISFAMAGKLRGVTQLKTLLDPVPNFVRDIANTPKVHRLQL